MKMLLRPAAWPGATGFGAANWVADVVVDVVGGGARLARGLVVGCVAGEVADWKSSKSSSSFTTLGRALEVAGALPLEAPDVGGSSPKSKRSCSGSFGLGVYFLAAAVGGAVLVVVVVGLLTVLEGSASLPSSYSSNWSPRR